MPGKMFGRLHTMSDVRFGLRLDVRFDLKLCQVKVRFFADDVRTLNIGICNAG